MHSQNEWVLNLMINFRFDNLRRVEYMEGIDTIDGVVYDDLSAYKLEDLEDLIKLKSLLKIAAKAESLSEFEEKAEIYFNPKDKK